MVKPFLLLLSIVSTLFLTEVFGQEKLSGNALQEAAGNPVVSISVENPSLLTSDRNGNIYVVSDRNTLLRYDLNGEPSGQYNNIQNGQLEWVDASNPLKILLYYPQYNTLEILSKMLSQKATLNLRQLGLMSVSACGMAEDGNVWIYDNAKARLLKINNQLEIISESNDLRSETGTVPNPVSLTAAGGKVFLCDTVNGIYTFDQYGTYQNILPFKEAKQIQVLNHQLVWFSDGRLHRYDIRNFQTSEINLPPETINAMVYRNRLYVLMSGQISIFYLPSD